jgi:hypothetical protein
MRTLKQVCEMSDRKINEIADDTATIATAMQVQAAQYKINHEKTKEIYACLIEVWRERRAGNDDRGKGNLLNAVKEYSVMNNELEIITEN